MKYQSSPLLNLTYRIFFLSDWVYKPTGKKAEDSKDQFVIQNNEKIHNVPNLVKLAARPIQPAPATPDTPKSTVPAVTSAKLLSLSAIPIQAVSAAPPISPIQATSTPIKALYPRAVLAPGAPANKTINICLSNNGILHSQQSPGVSATTKYLLTNKIGHIRQNNGLAANGERETSIQIPHTSTDAIQVVQNTKPQGDAASVSPVTLASSVKPADIRSSTEHPVLTPIVTTNNGQMQNFSLSRLLAEPLDPNSGVSRKFLCFFSAGLSTYRKHSKHWDTK